MVVGLPTGGVDWYQDDSGALIWQPGHAATWTDDDGQVYNNIGITANYAQNYINQDGSKIIAHFLGLTDGSSTLLYTTDLPKGTPDGEVTSIGAGFALGGGGDFELGYVSDWTGKARWFANSSVNIGLAAGFGLNHRFIKSNPGHQFKVTDYAGNGSFTVPI